MIQFVTRGSVQVNDRAMEVQKGLPEDISVSISWTGNSVRSWFTLEFSHVSEGQVLATTLLSEIYQSVYPVYFYL